MIDFLHKREQLSIHDLFIDVNKPVSIDHTLLGRWKQSHGLENLILTLALDFMPLMLV
jgi:hypothetical protein